MENLHPKSILSLERYNTEKAEDSRKDILRISTDPVDIALTQYIV